ncbi:MAG TPA: LamG-like jellyroll fold domain-containing protein [Cellulomonas sp.]
MVHDPGRASRADRPGPTQPQDQPQDHLPVRIHGRATGLTPDPVTTSTAVPSRARPAPPARRRARPVAAALAVALAGTGLGLTAGAGTAGAADSPALPEPALHYDFDAATPAALVPDVSGHGLDGTLAGVSTATVTAGSPATGGNALVLPGGSVGAGGAYVTLPAGALTGATDLTVSTRVRWSGSGGSWQWLTALGTGTEKYLFTTPANGDGNLRSAATRTFAGGEATVTGAAPLPSDGWRTVTVTLDTAADTLTTYLDGLAVGSVSTTVSASDLTGGGSAGYLGRSFYPADPLFGGAVDDLRIYHQALSAEQVAALQGTPLAAVTGLTEDTFALRTGIDQAPDLPATVLATFSDGYDRAVPVVWNPVDPAQYADRGTFTVAGSAADRPVSATVQVVRAGELRIDLGTDTGEFHGGASGTLYGLYGAGVPTNNLIEGMHLRTVSTKAQDGPQHPGADALEVVQPLADSTDGDVYIYMTDIHRGFPYQWEGSTPAEKLATYSAKLTTQVEQVLTLEPEYQDNIVFVPFNEPEGNMFGTGEWSLDGTSWLDDPADYFTAWDDTYALITGLVPDARIAGPNTSILFSQVKGFLEHTVEAGTVPQVMTWHELSDPATIRDSVARYRAWEAEVFAGTAYEGTELPININEYAYNYHTSVPGQMVQWIAAIEDAKVDADIAYWNIDGNLSDSAVQANRGNGQWWLYNAYGSMTGHTVTVDPPSPGESYTLQGLATLDEDTRQSRVLLGGADGPAWVQLDDVPADVFGSEVHALVREIAWTGQVGDSEEPAVVAELDLPVVDGSVSVDFGGDLPALTGSSAYEIVLTPGGTGRTSQVAPTLWSGTYEAEDATYTGSGYSKNGPEGSPADVAKFYTSGGYDVGGLRTGSDGRLTFTVDVPQDGTYDLSVFANSLNTYPLVADQGPTNVFLTVDGAAEQELFLTLGYKWVVWDHTDTTVDLTTGRHQITLAARSLDGTRATRGDTILDKIDLSLANPVAEDVYEAEIADLDGATTDYSRARASGSGVARLRPDDSVTFWVYSAEDARRTIEVTTLGGGMGMLTVNGTDVAKVNATKQVTAFLVGGVNKITVTGLSGSLLLDRLVPRAAATAGDPVVYEAEDATVAGDAAPVALSLASGGRAVTGVGGEPGNDSTLTFDVVAPKKGGYAVTVRYSNPEQSPATHYNPDPLARHADISVNGGEAVRTLFPHTFHQNVFWELTVPLDLKKGHNTVTFSAEELPGFDGETLISDTFPDVLLRSRYAPVIDRIAVSPLADRAVG